jgi:hypothetical protein
VCGPHLPLLPCMLSDRRAGEMDPCQERMGISCSDGGKLCCVMHATPSLVCPYGVSARKEWSLDVPVAAKSIFQSSAWWSTRI